MNRPFSSQVLPHELFFGTFLAVQWLRLVLAAGVFDPVALLYLGLLVASVFVAFRCHANPGKARWLLRLWFYPVAMNVVFFTMGSAVAKVGERRFDEALAGWDRALFGATLSARAEAMAAPVLTELLSFCYLLFFPYLFLSWIHYARRGLPLLRKLFVGVFTIYGLGFLGYALVPAAGPHLAQPEQFAGPLSGWVITRLNAAIVANGSNGVDVFPSLHCALTCFLVFFDRRHSPRRFHLWLAPCVGLWLATIYLRYHYAADVVCGFALAFFALWLANWWEKTAAPFYPENQPAI